ncbi:DNA alkylation repair protein [Pseudarthrobacter sp. NamB4]|uniref:DNA alkylation repair protein n=1 Tax=Pseudarthrobacter sp. NamB4 TaxID=2576837 RepID=UPI0010FD6A19|nr:DNA alkylation repair protein [Pseudarthrobacter sp. NamB4]TLM73577.1 DNA alkylation repair protein [Pseudarthrobacter sp. NamB4]
MSSSPDYIAGVAGFVDRTLQNEGAWYRADDVESRLGGSLASYGSSVGAVRGTVRDALRKFKELDRDGVVLLASALWGRPKPGARPVFERRLAAVVLLQSRWKLLSHSDLTRIEGFLRSAESPELATPLLGDVVAPLVSGLAGRDRQKANVVLARWSQDPDRQLRAAAAFLECCRAEVPYKSVEAPHKGENHERSL